MDSGMFIVVVPHTHPNFYSSPLYKLEKKLNQTREVLTRMVPQSDLNKTNNTTSFWLFWIRTKTEVVRLHGC